MTLHGRSVELRQLTDDCLAGRFVTITSAPGLGASALLAVGLLPALRSEGLLPVLFSAWQGRDFTANLKEAIAGAVRQKTGGIFFVQAETLAELLSRAHRALGHPVALLLDQFEDCLRCHAGTALQDDFDAELAAAVTLRKGQVVVALHETSLPAFERLGHLIPNLLGHRLQLAPISRDAARNVVRELAAGRGVVIEDAVVDGFATAQASTAGDGVHPWLLTRGVERLLAAAKAKSTGATVATVEVLGGADALILQCLDTEIGELSTSHREVLFLWCQALISTDGRRVSATAQALTERAGKLSRFSASLLPLLLENGMLRVITIGGTQRYELARESQVVILQDWWARQDSIMQAKRRAQFRVRSMTIAIGSVLIMYVVWMYLSWK